MALKIKEASTTPIVSLQEIKAHCVVEHTDDDDLLTSYVASATSYLDGIDGVLGVSVGNHTWELYLDNFPSGAIQIPLGPVTDILSVECILSGSDIYSTVSPDDYFKDTVSPVSRIVPARGWPSTEARPNAVRVTFAAGHGAASESIKQAVKLLAGHWYETREAVSVGGTASEIPFSVRSIIDQCKNWRV